MGYYSHLSGEIIIEPPMRWDTLRGEANRFLPEAMREGTRDWADVEILVEEFTQDTPTGRETLISGTQIIPHTEDSSKLYKIEESLAELGAIAGRHGLTLTGELVRTGEDAGDIERYYFDGARLVAEKAVLTWPDGSKVEI